MNRQRRLYNPRIRGPFQPKDDGKTVDSSLTDEFALASLSTGILKVTTGSGALSVGVAGTDFILNILALT